MKWLVGVPVVSATVFFSLVSEAYGTGSRSTGVFPSGYMSCREEREVGVRPANVDPAQRSELIVPLPRQRRVPSSIVLGDDIADEVARVEPVPAGRRTSVVPPKRELAEVVLRESANNYLCLGLVRGRAGILRTIDAPAGTRFYGHSNKTSWRIDNMVAASVFHLVETKDALRTVLARPISDEQCFEKAELRTAAAVALSELGDRSSAPAVAAWTEQLESRTFGFQYRNTLHALERLDPAVAETYALGLLERVADGKLGKRVHANRLRVLPMLSSRSRDVALPTLRRLTAKGMDDAFDGFTSRCDLTAARLQYRDPELVPLAREQIFGSLSHELAVNCYTQWLSVTIGDDPSDVEALLHRRAYDPMLRFVQHLHRKRAEQGGANMTWERAGLRLHRGLTRILSEPQLGDRSRNDYFPTHRAKHLAAMAGLEDAKARRLLYEMIEDPEDRTDGAWVAAYWALKLRLPGAPDHVLRRLELGIEKLPHLASTSFSVGITTTWRTRVLEELVHALPTDDARWTIALLDRQGAMREKATFLLSRRLPRGACEAVIEAAKKVPVWDERVKQAFWALSILAKACWEPMSRAAKDTSLAPGVRGPAIVLLAMTRSPQAKALADALDGDPDFRLYVHTSNIILKSPE